MARYPLNLPTRLKQEAEREATSQGVSLNQFILWAVAEKVGELREGLADPTFPQIAYRRGGSGSVEPVIRGTAIHVKALAIAHHAWAESPADIAAEYDLDEGQVREALSFYETHRHEIDAAISADAALEAGRA